MTLLFYGLTAASGNACCRRVCFTDKYFYMSHAFSPAFSVNLHSVIVFLSNFLMPVISVRSFVGYCSLIYLFTDAQGMTPYLWGGGWLISQDSVALH